MENSKKTRLYLIRHGETLWNRAGKYQGWTNISLSEEGVEQAKLLGKRFQYLPLDRIYVSPLDRALATAQEIANVKGIPITINEYFKEINFGEWEGYTIPELTEKFGKPYIDFFKNPFEHPMPGEGSFQNVGKRAMAGYEEIMKNHKGEKIAIVSHGGLLRVLLVELLGLDFNIYQSMWLTNTSITVVDIYEDGRKYLMTLNDKAHLEMAELLR